MIDTGQVREGGQVVFPLEPVHNPQGLFAGATARPIGDGAEIRSVGQEGRDLPFEEIPLPLIGFRGEKFKRDDGLPRRHFRRQDVPDESHGIKLWRAGQKMPSFVRWDLGK
jgi:hypothetical protein